jgi:hypothetical protein
MQYDVLGVVRLTTDKPAELWYRLIFRNVRTGADDLCFEGVQVGGMGSQRGVVGVSTSRGNSDVEEARGRRDRETERLADSPQVAFLDAAQREDRPFNVLHTLATEVEAARNPIQLVPRPDAPDVHPCWLWKQE